MINKIVQLLMNTECLKSPGLTEQEQTAEKVDAIGMLNMPICVAVVFGSIALGGAIAGPVGALVGLVVGVALAIPLGCAFSKALDNYEWKPLLEVN